MTDLDNELSGAVIGAAMKVHSALGPGLLEKTYEECLCYLLIKQGFKIERQKAVPVRFEEVFLDAGFRMDLLIEDKLVVELKSVEKIIPIHEAQLYTYLKLASMPYGLILNFNVKSMRDGIKRMAMTRNSA